MDDVNQWWRIDDEHHLNIGAVLGLSGHIKFLVLAFLRIRRSPVTHHVFRFFRREVVQRNVFDVRAVPSKFHHALNLTTIFWPVECNCQRGSETGMAPLILPHLRAGLGQGRVDAGHGFSGDRKEKQNFVDLVFRPLFRSKRAFSGVFRSRIRILGRRKGGISVKNAKNASNTCQSLTNPASNTSRVCRNWQNLCQVAPLVRFSKVAIF